MTLLDPLAGLLVLERGWLSSNNIVILPAGREEAAVLVDTGHAVHAPQTLALLRQALPHQRLGHIVNTHLHSDHCGGNAAVKAAFGAAISVAPSMADAVRQWSPTALTYEATGQWCPRFEADQALALDEAFEAGGRTWEVLPAPGHDPDSLILFDRAAGVLLSADALWAQGFGVVFPEVADQPGFDDVEWVLDQIAALPVRVVVPGHGAPFTDVSEALARARSRLAAFRADPRRHARHAAKVLISYHLMEQGPSEPAALREWALATRLLDQAAGQLAVVASGREAWVTALLEELASSGAITRDAQGRWCSG